MRRILARLLGDRSAAAALEFAIISVPLVLLSVGTVDFGRVLYIRSDMDYAADLGARLILIDGLATDAAVAAEVREAFVAGPPNDLEISMGVASESGVIFRTISLSYRVDLLTPFVSAGEITLTHDRRVPVE